MKINFHHLFFSVFFTVFLSAQGSRIADFPSSKKLIALFVFGDSFFDPGNNNFINTTDGFRANFSPYGRTFFNFPTGRFCDGRIIPDFIAEYANLPLIPSYLDPHNDVFIHGVNFASGGGGALVQTHRGFVIDLETQVSYFKKVEKSLRKKLGEAMAKSLLSNSVYLISIGGNDYIVPSQEDPTLLQNCTTTDYVHMVLGNLTTLLQEIYKKGGMKFAFVTVPPIGCFPSARLKDKDGDGSCSDEGTTLVTLHNKLLPLALHKLAVTLQGFKYTVADTYTMMQTIIDNPFKYGFKEGKTACCGSGEFRGIFSCGGKRDQIKKFELCENQNDYLFFDSLHVNEKAYGQFSKLMWSGDAQLVKPYSLKELFRCDELWA